MREGGVDKMRMEVCKGGEGKKLLFLSVRTFWMAPCYFIYVLY